MDRKVIIAVAVLALLVGGAFFYIISQGSETPGGGGGGGSISGEPEAIDNLKTFEAYEDIDNFLTEQSQSGSSAHFSAQNLSSTPYVPPVWDDDDWGDWDDDDDMDMAEDTAVPTSNSGGEKEYSTTNVQEKGVDEGDIVKTDGEYAYVVSEDKKKVCIIDVDPPGSSKIVKELSFDGSVKELYLMSDKLIVLGSGGTVSGNWISIYKITDRTNPELYRSESVIGSFQSSRMIGEWYYIITSQSTGAVKTEEDLPVLASEVDYVDEYDYSYVYTYVTAININSKTRALAKHVVLMGSSRTIYVSLNNIYLTYQTRISWAELKEKEIRNVIYPLLPKSYQYELEGVLEDATLSRKELISESDRIVGKYLETLSDSEVDEFRSEWRTKESENNRNVESERERTQIYRIAIKADVIRFMSYGEVPGTILNRFSMGEYKDHFRIATSSSRSLATNQLYVLDMSLDIVGNITNIAPGEKIYSARFVGNRAYMVTFKWIDPFFVIDLSEPTAPKVLGELKIPGFSNYLHVYDENHVIGLGKDADESIDAEHIHSDNAIYYTAVLGVKLSLFDVSDVKNPTEKSKYIIGDRGTESLAISDPHAFLFSLSKNLIVLPISLKEFDSSEHSSYSYGDYKGEFAYVFHVSPEKGFVLKGRISHSEETTGNWQSSDSAIKRSFYIDDTIYTVSNMNLKAHNMDSLTEEGSVDLPYNENSGYYYGEDWD